jgi:SAM-dependent methyltransferase
MSGPPDVPHLFDHAALRLRQQRAEQLGAESFLLDAVCDDLAERLGVVVRMFTDAVDLGTPGDALRKSLQQRAAKVESVDLFAPEGERLDLGPETVELVVSALALQFANDLPGVFAQVRRALKPDGLFLAAMIGGETLTELRQAFAAAEAECEGGVSPRVAPFIEIRELGALLQRAGFALPVTDADRLVVRYDNAFALMNDLRRMGATNVLLERRRAPLKRTTLLRMAAIYGERFADADGRIRATFDILWLSGWAPHASQQQPLQPGSAKASLADAVKTVRKT